MARIFQSERGQAGPGAGARAGQARPGPRDETLSRLQSIADLSAPANALDAMQRQVIQRAAPEEEEPLQGAGMQLAAPEEEEPLQGKAIQRAGAEDEEPLQGHGLSPVAQLKGDGMPSNLRAGVEALSGLDMSGVKVHRNSPQPAMVGAHAYAQGTDIHLAPGQERHLPHEAWHVAQQAQGRVAPTTSVAGQPVNDSPTLEAEADRMGAKALER